MDTEFLAADYAISSGADIKNCEHVGSLKQFNSNKNAISLREHRQH